jgi:hypothetical protein
METRRSLTLPPLPPSQAIRRLPYIVPVLDQRQRKAEQWRAAAASEVYSDVHSRPRNFDRSKRVRNMARSRLGHVNRISVCRRPGQGD